MGKMGKCCCATSCETACPTHSAKTSYTATVTGLAASFSVTLNQSTNPTQKCFFSGEACHLTSWSEKSTKDYGSTSWPSPFTWPTFPRPYLLPLSTTAANCSIGFPSSHPTQRRWESATLAYEKMRLVQQDRYQVNISIINYGPLNQLALTATYNVRFASVWQYMFAYAARWRSSDTRWDDPTFDWVVTTGSDNFDNIPTAPAFPSIPYQSSVLGVVPSFTNCNWDYAANDAAGTWPTKEIGRWDTIVDSGAACELTGDVATTVVEPRWETKQYTGFPESCVGAAANLDTGYNVTYTYESDPFTCDAIPDPIVLKKYPSYTDIAAVTETTNISSSCGTWVRIRDFIAIPKEFNVSLA